MDKTKSSERRFHEFLEIFRKIHENFGFNQSQIAKGIGVSPSSMSNYLSSRSYNPPSKILVKMRRYFDHLLKDEQKSQMKKNLSFSPMEVRQIPLIYKWDLTGEKFSPGFFKTDKFKPILSSRLRDPKSFFVIATTDSMTGSVIQEGDYLLVEPGMPLQSGDLVLCYHPNFGLVVRRYCNPLKNISILLPIRDDCSFLTLNRKEFHESQIYRIGYIEREL
jgi:SOS-response transcriptional repressor LexA